MCSNVGSASSLKIKFFLFFSFPSFSIDGLKTKMEGPDEELVKKIRVLLEKEGCAVGVGGLGGRLFAQNKQRATLVRETHGSFVAFLKKRSEFSVIELANGERTVEMRKVDERKTHLSTKPGILAKSTSPQSVDMLVHLLVACGGSSPLCSLLSGKSEEAKAVRREFGSLKQCLERHPCVFLLSGSGSSEVVNLIKEKANVDERTVLNSAIEGKTVQKTAVIAPQKKVTSVVATSLQKKNVGSVGASSKMRCSVCEKEFGSAKAVVLHTKMKHGPEKTAKAAGVLAGIGSAKVSEPKKVDAVPKKVVAPAVVVTDVPNVAISAAPKLQSFVSGNTVGRSKGLPKNSVKQPEPKVEKPRARRNSLKLEALEPPISSNGVWMVREEFPGRKSFGWFECSCNKTWLSAHAFKIYCQGCQKCEAERLPKFLWFNFANSDEVCNDDSSSESSSDAPHDRGRCEACRNGDCIDN